MVVGKWWTNSIEVVEIGDKLIALDGWNGQIYRNCFEVYPFHFKENERGKTYYTYVGEKKYIVAFKYGENLESDDLASAIIGFEISEVN